MSSATGIPTSTMTTIAAPNAMINANREVMAVIAGVFFFLPSLAAVFLLPTIETLPQGADLEEVRKFLIDFYSANAVPFILMGLAQAVGFISLLALLRDDRKPTVGEAIKNGFVGLLPYIGVELIIAFGAAIVVMVLVGIPVALDITALAFVTMIAAIVALVYVMIKLSLVTPVIAIEKDMNPISILKRSWALTKGNSLRLFLFYFLLAIAYIVIAGVIGLILGLGLNLLGDGIAYKIADGTVEGLMSSAGTLIFAAILAAVHRQLAGPSTGNLSETFE